MNKAAIRSPQSAIRETIWRFDPSHTFVEFSVRNFLFNAKGRLKSIEGVITLDEENVRRSSVSATIKADSIDTGIARRDEDLRSSHFLNVRIYPQILFESSSVGPGKDRDVLSVKGLLTVAGKTKEIDLEVSEVDRSRSPRGEEVIYYCATVELDRFAFGINYGRGLIGRKLKVAINVQANRER